MKKRMNQEKKQRKTSDTHQYNKKKQASKSLNQRKRKTKRSIRRKNGKKKKTVLRDIILTTFFTIFLSLTIGSIFFKVTTVQGHSMIPNLRDGDILLIKKRTDLRRFDLVTFMNEKNNVQARRLIGLPGEKIVYKEDTLYVDDQPVDEKFIVDEVNESQRNGKNFTEDFTSEDLTSTKTIPEGYYLVLGDNRPYAADSRVYGLISAENMIGKVYFHWSLSNVKR